MSAVMLRNASDICGSLGDMSRVIPQEDEDIIDVMESIKSYRVDNRLARYDTIISQFMYFIRICLRKAENLHRKKSTESTRSFVEDNSKNLSRRYIRTLGAKKSYDSEYEICFHRIQLSTIKGD